MNDSDDTTAPEDLAKKLKAAGKKAERVKSERQARARKGSHLTEQLLATATDAGMNIDDKSGFHKVSYGAKGPKLYVDKKGGRVDLHFTLEGQAVIALTEEEAKKRHLGKVRGQIDFDASDEAVLSAFAAALAYIQANSTGTAPAAEEPAQAAVG